MEFKLSNYNTTPLMCAALRGNETITQLLLSKPKIDINCKDI